MEERITREELLERLFHDDYENLKGKKLRLTRVRVPGKSLDFAHVFTHRMVLFMRILRFISEYMKAKTTEEKLSGSCV